MVEPRSQRNPGRLTRSANADECTRVFHARGEIRRRPRIVNIVTIIASCEWSTRACPRSLQIVLKIQRDKSTQTFLATNKDRDIINIACHRSK